MSLNIVPFYFFSILGIPFNNLFNLRNISKGHFSPLRLKIFQDSRFKKFDIMSLLLFECEGRSAEENYC